MEAVLSRRTWPERSEAIKNFHNWLICWLLLPNLGFWLLWIVGGPPRWKDILYIGVLGVLTHRMSYSARCGFFVLAMIYAILAFISSLFNLKLSSLLYSIQLASELNLSASVEYVACTVGVIATFGAGAFFLRRPVTLARPSLIIAAVGLVSCAAVTDYWMGNGRRGSYKRYAEAGAPFTSGTLSSGFERAATGQRHAVMIVAEAMGLPKDPALRQQLINIWARPEVRARYEVTTGDTLFYGSTTNGEMRELCGRWGDYFEVMEVKADCLPARLTRKGYHTQGWHSFEGLFFERTSWYPNVGFQEAKFGPDLIQAGAGVCPGVFRGACDRDIPAQMGKTLRSAKQPQFLYWLTVNTHLPVVKHDVLETRHCEQFDKNLNANFPMTCRMFSLYDQTARALAKEITADDFPASDILIVGDHIPPFFDRNHREEFAPDRVPWIMLRRKVEVRDEAPPPSLRPSGARVFE